MFDLIALAFDADITRSVSFMLNREDGMGISDTFPLKLGLTRTHHNLSHAGDRDGQTPPAQAPCRATHPAILGEIIAGGAKRIINIRPDVLAAIAVEIDSKALEA